MIHFLRRNGSDVSFTDTCQGDSGGPIMAFYNNRWVLAGLTSFGIGCAEARYSGIYTRVSYFVPYIVSISNDSHVVSTTTATTVLISTSSVSPNQAIPIRQSIAAVIFTGVLLLIFQ